jgi:hypothetical protein
MTDHYAVTITKRKTRYRNIWEKSFAIIQHAPSEILVVADLITWPDLTAGTTEDETRRGDDIMQREGGGHESNPRGCDGLLFVWAAIGPASWSPPPHLSFPS